MLLLMLLCLQRFNDLKYFKNKKLNPDRNILLQFNSPKKLKKFTHTHVDKITSISFSFESEFLTYFMQQQ